MNTQRHKPKRTARILSANRQPHGHWTMRRRCRAAGEKYALARVVAGPDLSPSKPYELSLNLATLRAKSLPNCWQLFTYGRLISGSQWLVVARSVARVREMTVTRSHISVRAADDTDVADLVLVVGGVEALRGAHRAAGRADRRPPDRRASAPAPERPERPHLAGLDRRRTRRHGDGDHGAARRTQRERVRAGRVHRRGRAVPSPRGRAGAHGRRGRRTPKRSALSRSR